MVEQHTSFPQAPTADANGAEVAVLLPLPLREAYDYRAPPGLALGPGDYVEVPLGPRRALGVVWGPGTGRLDAGRLKPVVRRFDVPPMPAILRRLVDWVAAYTMSAPGAVLKMALGGAALEPPRPIVAYAASAVLPAGLKQTPARRRVLALLDGAPPLTMADLAREAACGAGVVRGLVEAGALEAVMLAAEPHFNAPDWRRAGLPLSPAQARAAAALAAKVSAGGYSVSVLDGVTGSGKTEVYFEAIAAALAAGRQTLVLLPEIALGAQWLDRFARRFGAPPAEWHSELSGAQRRATWRAVASGAARVVVGARSALFLPFPDLGLIVVDEEHDAAFKQEDGVVYHARDMAVARAHLGGHPIVLSSATPSLETLVNAESGRYARLCLPSRHGRAALPTIRAIDLRADRPERGRWLSPSLRAATAEALASGEQIMLFLNRRGYAPLTLCRVCGFRLHCPQCTAWLVEHRLTRRLHCHHCGHAAALPDACPSCGAEGALAACGPGVERVAEEVAELFPDARAAVMASDTLAGPRAAREMIRRMADREIDLLIGTQIMAKGHHFPMLTLVGVVDADLGLAGGDLRAAERTYQLLHQVAGRAGRVERPGTVLLQSHMPEHPVIRALVAGDRDALMALEQEERRRHGMPPYGRLAALIVSGAYAGAVDRVAAALGRAAPRSDGITVLGPAPAPLAMLRGRHRRRLLMKAPRGVAVQPVLARWLGAVVLPSTVRVQVDIDPYSFL